MLAGVIWIIGWCMILMALLVRLPAVAVGVFGVVVIAGPQHHRPLPARRSDRCCSRAACRWLWQMLYFGGPIRAGPWRPRPGGALLIVPWIGVMAAGYGFGLIMELPVDRRRRICLRLGARRVAAFLVLRGFNLYGDPRPWSGRPNSPMPALLRFLNTNKYPASLLFLLMTLGPMLLLLPALENARGRIADALAMFGRVPFFFYVLHIPLIHALALVVSLIRTGAVDPWLFTNHPMMNPEPPDGYTWSLSLLYLVWALAIVILYFACRWFAGVKAGARAPGCASSEPGHRS